MTEAEWLRCTDPGPLLEYLRERPNERKLRQFAIACIRPMLHRLWLDEYREAVEIAEQFLEGQASREEYESAKALFPGAEHWENVIHSQVPRHHHCEALFNDDAWKAADAIIGPAGYEAALEYHAQHKADPGYEFLKSVDSHRRSFNAAQAGALREIFGNPFRPVSFNAAWRTSNVVALATAISASRDFDRMPILGDALEDAGCTNADILEHCRGPGPHLWGCWALELLREDRIAPCREDR